MGSGALLLLVCSSLALASALSPDIPLCPDSRLCANPAGSSCTIRKGCRYCTCTSLQPCGLPVCKKPCLYGQVIEKDRNGCDVCRCKPRCPPRPQCTLYTKCGKGYKMVNGCISPTCECNKPTCGLLNCQAQQCPLGFAQDSFGFACPTCECRRRQSPVACPALPCLALLDCFGGSRVAIVNGCPVCRCESAPICEPLRHCYIKCAHGNVHVNGCPICRCRSAPINCPTLDCPRVYCRRGFAADKEGCPTCRCNRGYRYGKRRGSFK